MLVTLNFEETRVSKDYTLMLESIEEAMKKIPDFFTLDIEGTIIDIEQLAYYIVSEHIAADGVQTTGKYLSSTEIGKIIRESDRIEHRVYEEWSTDELRANSMLGGPYSLFSGIRGILESNTIVRAGIVTDAVFITMLCGANVLQYPVPSPYIFAMGAMIFWTWERMQSLLNRRKSDKGLGFLMFVNSLASKTVSIHKYFVDMFRGEKGAEMAFRWLKRNAELNSPVSTTVELLPELLALILDLAKQDDVTKEMIDQFVTVVPESGCHYMLNTLLPKRKLKECAAAALIFSTVSASGDLRICVDAMIWFANYKAEEWGLSAQKKEIADCLLAQGSRAAMESSWASFHAMFEGAALSLGKKDAQNQDILLRTNRRLDSETKRATDLRGEVKRQKQQVSEFRQKLKVAEALQAKLEKQVTFGDSGEKVEELEASVQKLSEQVESLQTANAEQSRKLSKRVRELGETRARLQQKTEECKRLAQELQSKKDAFAQQEVHEALKQVPLECFVNAIKDAKVAIVGGDMVHGALRAMGLSNYLYYKSNYCNYTPKVLESLDLLVVMTSYVDHSSTVPMLQRFKAENQQILMFTNRNAEMLVYSIFTELNKRK